MQENKTIIEIRNEGYLREYCMCRYIRQDHFDILKLIAEELNRMFPDRKAKNLEVVCAGPKVGEPYCVGNEAHGYRGDTFDLNYFTLGDTNHSQWPPPIVDIWKDRGGLDSEVSHLFDAARNIAFFIMLKKVFPKAQVIVDTRIKKAMVYSTFNKEDIAALSYLSEDSPMNMNHHIHTHIYTQGHNDDAIDWKYVNEVLIKKEVTMEQVWQVSKEAAVKLATEQCKKILLLGGNDSCGYCSEMKAIIASSPIKEVVASCFVLWYGQVISGKPEWETITGTYSIPMLAVIDPAKPDEYLERTFGRQDATELYNRLLKYPCITCGPADPYANLDLAQMYKEYQYGVSLEYLPIRTPPKAWCEGFLSRPASFAGATVVFTDNVTKVKVSGLENFTKEQVMSELYEKFPAIKAVFDAKYCKECVPCPECEPCIEPACLLADIKALGEPLLESILNRVVCKIYGTCK